MSAEEVLVPFTADDFDIGDDVFRINHGPLVEFGRIHDVDENIIDIIMENGERHWIPVADFKDTNTSEGWKLKIAKSLFWGKMMDTSTLSAGTEISRFDMFNQVRILGKVKEFVLPTEDSPGKITLDWPERNQEIPYTVKTMYELKRLMLFYAVEG